MIGSKSNMRKPYDVKVDLYDTDKLQKTDIRYVVGDRRVYPLTIILVANEEPYPISEDAIVILCFSIFGEPFYGTAEITNGQEGIVSYKIPSSLISVSGVIDCRVEVQDAGKILTWPTPFRFTVIDVGERGKLLPPGLTSDWVNNADKLFENHESRITALENAENNGNNGNESNNGNEGNNNNDNNGSNGEMLKYFTSAAMFPNIGSDKTLYIVTTQGREEIYRWDAADLKYFLVSNNYKNITIISGGNANG